MSADDTRPANVLPQVDGAPTKAWRTLQAELLLAGYCAELLDSDDGAVELVVTRWAFTRRFRDLAVARAWAAQVLGRDRKPLHQPAAQDVQQLPNGAARETEVPARC